LLRLPRRPRPIDGLLEPPSCIEVGDNIKILYYLLHHRNRHWEECPVGMVNSPLEPYKFDDGSLKVLVRTDHLGVNAIDPA
jgi:hypothetical protein